jgi:hypothetical protein
MSLPPFIGGLRYWVNGPTGYYEKPSRTARLQLRVLGWWLESRRS